MNRVAVNYVKEMQDYDYMKYTWKEITNVSILEKMQRLSEELATYKFKYKVKLSKFYNNRGRIIVKSTLSRADMILLLGKLFAGELELKWR